MRKLNENHQQLWLCLQCHWGAPCAPVNWPTDFRGRENGLGGWEGWERKLGGVMKTEDGEESGSSSLEKPWYGFSTDQALNWWIKLWQWWLFLLPEHSTCNGSVALKPSFTWHLNSSPKIVQFIWCKQINAAPSSPQLLTGDQVMMSVYYLLPLLFCRITDRSITWCSLLLLNYRKIRQLLTIVCCYTWKEAVYLWNFLSFWNTNWCTPLIWVFIILLWYEAMMDGRVNRWTDVVVP